MREKKRTIHPLYHQRVTNSSLAINIQELRTVFDSINAVKHGASPGLPYNAESRKTTPLPRLRYIPSWAAPDFDQVSSCYVNV